MMFTVERQYLVPIYQPITLEAADAAAACAAALDEVAYPWDGDRIDYESAQETTISGVWVGTEAHQAPYVEVAYPPTAAAGPPSPTVARPDVRGD